MDSLGRRFEDGTIHSLPQDYADQLGWEELTKITMKRIGKYRTKSKAMIYAENIWSAGAISVIKTVWLTRAGEFWNWQLQVLGAEAFDPGYRILLFTSMMTWEKMCRQFSDIKIAGSISNKDAREYNTNVYLCTAPVRSF